MAQDVADDQLLAGLLGGGGDRLGLGDRDGDGLLREHVAAGRERLAREVGVRVGIGSE